jgi:hypothetical protein
MTDLTELKIPLQEDHSRYYPYYDKHYTDYFFDCLMSKDYDIKKTETVYCLSKSISQTKLREAGFKITRSASKADLIIMDNYLKKAHEITYNTYGNNSTYDYRLYGRHGVPFKDALLEIETIIATNITAKFVYVSDVYKALYKYEGNVDIFKSLSELFESKNDNNITMAMEMMVNANWESNELYLAELFNNYYDPQIRFSTYKNSISFKSFLASGADNYVNIRLREARHYKNFCSTEEHHQYVFNKFEEKFKDELDWLLEKFKLKMTGLSYEIDRDVNKDEEND